MAIRAAILVPLTIPPGGAIVIVDMGKVLLSAAIFFIAVSAHARWPAVPEMDPGLASTGIALLSGALLIAFGRGKR